MFKETDPSKIKMMFLGVIGITCFFYNSNLSAFAANLLNLMSSESPKVLQIYFPISSFSPLSRNDSSLLIAILGIWATSIDDKHSYSLD